MANAIITGTVETVMNTHVVSDKFQKREMVVNTGGEWPQLIKVQFVQDQVSLLDSLVNGMEIEVHVDLRGRSWTKPETGVVSYFNTIQGWKISVVGELEKPTGLQDASAPLIDRVVPKMNGDMANQFNESQSSANTEDDLPF